LHPTTHPIGSYKGKKLLGRGYMQHNDSRPSYLLMGLIEKSELRELLDELYLYALEPTKEFASIG
jgi:hypothetical protein